MMEGIFSLNGDFLLITKIVMFGKRTRYSYIFSNGLVGHDYEENLKEAVFVGNTKCLIEDFLKKAFNHADKLTIVYNGLPRNTVLLGNNSWINSLGFARGKNDGLPDIGAVKCLNKSISFEQFLYSFIPYIKAA